MAVNYKIVGNNVKYYRKKMHVTQEQMAEDLFLSVSLISKLERGVKSISMETLDSIAIYLKTTIGGLLEDPDEQRTAHTSPVQELENMLAGLDNTHLAMVRNLTKAYAEQVRSTYA